MSKTFHILKVLSGSTWVMLIQYFLPSLAICSFFYLSESCFKDFLIVFYNIFFLSSLEFIHYTKKSTTKTGSTLKSELKSTFWTSYSTTGSTFSTFFSSWFLLLFFFIALYSYSFASCYFLSFSSKMACFYF